MDIPDNIKDNYIFKEHHLTNADLLNKIVSLGFTNNDDKFIDFLENHSYSQLKPYIKLILQENKQDLGLSEIKKLYKLDDDLRLLFFANLKEIEIAIRSVLISAMHETYGHYWISDSNIFNPSLYDKIKLLYKTVLEKKHTKQRNIKIKKLLDNSKEIPAFMIINYLSFGDISKLLSAIDCQNSQNKKLISYIENKFKTNFNAFQKIIFCLSQFRNALAHHDFILCRTSYLKLPKSGHYSKVTHKNLEFVAHVYWLSRFSSKITSMPIQSNLFHKTNNIINSYNEDYIKDLMALYIIEKDKMNKIPHSKNFDKG